MVKNGIKVEIACKLEDLKLLNSVDYDIDHKLKYTLKYKWINEFVELYDARLDNCFCHKKIPSTECYDSYYFE